MREVVVGDIGMVMNVNVRGIEIEIEVRRESGRGIEIGTEIEIETEIGRGRGREIEIETIGVIGIEIVTAIVFGHHGFVGNGILGRVDSMYGI